MTDPSDARWDGSLIKRRTTLLLIPGALIALLSRPTRVNADTGPKPTSRPDTNAVSGSPDLKRLGPAHQVRAIGYRNRILSMTTADGRTTDFPERNLHFRIDSGKTGPLRGAPVLLPAGKMGDRAWVVFAAPDEISTFVEHQG